jgi:hypothetical protein
MALVIAKVASLQNETEDEAYWLRETETLTVRAMVDRVRARTEAQRAESRARGLSGTNVALETNERDAGMGGPGAPDVCAAGTHDEPFRSLTVTVDREDAWLPRLRRSS